MTTNTKDITELVDLHCNSIHFAELDRLLKKLDHEDLDVLRVMLEEVYEPREALADAYINGHYDKGYNDGYETALSEATEDNGYEAGYADGYDSGGSYD